MTRGGGAVRLVAGGQLVSVAYNLYSDGIILYPIGVPVIGFTYHIESLKKRHA